MILILHATLYREGGDRFARAARRCSAPRETRRLLPGLARGWAGRLRRPECAGRLRRLVADPRGRTMLQDNPIGAEHELEWYLESRFPGRRVETIDLGRNARVLAPDGGPLQPGTVAPRSYP